jgi:hypothetical protein
VGNKCDRHTKLHMEMIRSHLNSPSLKGFCWNPSSTFSFPYCQSSLVVHYFMFIFLTNEFKSHLTSLFRWLERPALAFTKVNWEFLYAMCLDEKVYPNVRLYHSLPTVRWHCYKCHCHLENTSWGRHWKALLSWRVWKLLSRDYMKTVHGSHSTSHIQHY